MIKITCACFIVFSLTSIHVFAQNNKEAYKYKYDPITEDYFKGYKSAKLKIDYYFTDGYSTGNRYSYEVIVIDSLIMLGFSSPGVDADGYKYISYQKKFLLSNSELGAIKSALINSKLKQKKNGIPRPDGTAHTKEVLIVKYKHINIGGGMAYANIVSFPTDESDKMRNKEIAEDRVHSSSIGGNYDLLITTIRKKFVDLDKLKKQSMPKK